MKRTVLLAALALAACGGEAPPPAIKFVTYGPGHASKPDRRASSTNFRLRQPIWQS
jgi:hypothetical protein